MRLGGLELLVRKLRLKDYRLGVLGIFLAWFSGEEMFASVINLEVKTFHKANRFKNYANFL